MLSKQVRLASMKRHSPRGVLAGALKLAKQLGFDFVEMSVDETDERLSRLDWSQEQRLALVSAVAETGRTRAVYVPQCPPSFSAWQ